MRAILIFLFFSTVANAQVPATQMPSVNLPPALARVLRDYEKAWQARDAAALAELFTEDGFVLASGKAPVRGRDAVRQAYAGSGGPLLLRAVAYSTSGAVGYIIGGFRTEQDAPDMGKFVLAIRKGPRGRWLIAADMDNMNTPPRRAPAPAPQ